MVDIKLNTNTLSMLIAGLYCADNEVDSIAIPFSIWFAIAEKLEYFLPSWDYEKITFEQYIKNCILIFPKEMIPETELKNMQRTTLYWEYPNGNVILSISMDIQPINGE